MTDCIGHEINIGDYVTCPFYSGSVSLFEVVGFRKSRRKWLGTQVALRRTVKIEDFDENRQKRPVYKESDMLTWVDKNYVLLHFLEGNITEL
jgi:hypothetical protein